MIWSFLRLERDQGPQVDLRAGHCLRLGGDHAPLDAIIIALPIGIAMLPDLRTLAPRQIFTNLAFLLAAAAPFLGLQLITNIGITGKWYRTPFDLYAQRDYPGTTLGFHQFDPNLRPASKLPQKQKFHDEWTIPAIKAHQPDQVFHTWLGRDVQHPGKLQAQFRTTCPIA